MSNKKKKNNPECQYTQPKRGIADEKLSKVKEKNKNDDYSFVNESNYTDIRTLRSAEKQITGEMKHQGPLSKENIKNRKNFQKIFQCF